MKDHPAASHKIVHNYITLTEMFETAGFEVVLLEYCDENGRFYYNKWDANDGVIFRSKGMILEIKAINLVFHR